MKRWLLVLAVVVPVNEARAASFDCARAESPVERLICSDPQVSKLDERLDKAYRAAEATGMWRRKALALDQRGWLENVRGKCSDAPCLVRAYQARIEELGRLRDVTGTYKREGGLLKVRHFPAEHRIAFELYASAAMNTGELAGEAELRGGEASYPTDAERLRRAGEHERDDCTVRLTFSRDSAVVAQIGACGMGLNVTATGAYTLVSREAP
jgi:uncharacterized protein